MQVHAKAQHAAYLGALEKANSEARALRAQIERLGATPEGAPPPSAEPEGKTKACSIM